MLGRRIGMLDQAAQRQLRDVGDIAIGEAAAQFQHRHDFCRKISRRSGVSTRAAVITIARSRSLKLIHVLYRRQVLVRRHSFLQIPRVARIERHSVA